MASVPVLRRASAAEWPRLPGWMANGVYTPSGQLEALAFQPLALHLSRPPHGFGGLTRPALGRLLEVPA